MVCIFILGVMHLHECPAQKNLPIYLIVMGVFTLVKFMSLVCQSCTKKSNEESEENKSKTNPLDQLCNIFLFTWFVAGRKNTFFFYYIMYFLEYD